MQKNPQLYDFPLRICLKAQCLIRSSPGHPFPFAPLPHRPKIFPFLCFSWIQQTGSSWLESFSGRQSVQSRRGAAELDGRSPEERWTAGQEVHFRAHSSWPKGRHGGGSAQLRRLGPNRLLAWIASHCFDQVFIAYIFLDFFFALFAPLFICSFRGSFLLSLF